MNRCGIDGTAEITEVAGFDRSKPEYIWSRADPAIHVASELLDNEQARAFISERYAIEEPCPHQPGAVHARRRA
jgi:hypothetical protein